MVQSVVLSCLSCLSWFTIVAVVGVVCRRSKNGNGLAAKRHKEAKPPRNGFKMLSVLVAEVRRSFFLVSIWFVAVLSVLRASVVQTKRFVFQFLVSSFWKGVPMM